MAYWIAIAEKAGNMLADLPGGQWSTAAESDEALGQWLPENLYVLPAKIVRMVAKRSTSFLAGDGTK